MYISNKNIELDISPKILSRYDMSHIAYFDIETTGFDKEQDNIILISLGYYSGDNIFTVKQYFGENLEDEKSILENFKNDLQRFGTWCSYNGKAFDEPFIKYRIDKYNIKFMAPREHFDLYRKIKPYQKQLGLDRCNLKSVEKYMGIQREDTIDGGISVELYKRYLESKSEDLKKIIMLHNYEDVINLPKIFSIVWKIENSNDFIREDHVTDKQLKYLKYLLEKSNISLEAELPKISKKAASKLISRILSGNANSNELEEIINEY